MIRFDAGVLDQRVTLQRQVAGIDGYGQASTSWATVATVWARVQPLRGREFFAAAQMQAEVSTKISIRWRAGVAPTMRVLWRGLAHEIVSVIEPDGARTVLELMCLQGVRDGRAEPFSATLLVDGAGRVLVTADGRALYV